MNTAFHRTTYVALVLAAGLAGLGLMAPAHPTIRLTPRLNLSEYAFFRGKISDLAPSPGVFPYEVNAPLFSDYAEKKRFIYLPEGSSMAFRADGAFDFPNGSAIIKNFYYWKDAGHRELGRNILETRLLLKGESGWTALTYIWNGEQTDATLEVAGASFPVEWITADSKKNRLQYVVPNVNQCKGCHSYDGQFVPIGTSARQLNREEDGANQLKHWTETGKLQAPADVDWSALPALADYRKIAHPEKESAALLEKAARGYLEGNCAHCHNPHGPASTSGMFLNSDNADPEHLGVGKPPVAAGRGSGNRKYGIVPGKPGESILVYRMESNDPGIRMPELGRQIEHREGVELIKAWIRKM